MNVNEDILFAVRNGRRSEELRSYKTMLERHRQTTSEGLIVTLCMVLAAVIVFAAAIIQGIR